MEKLTPKKLYMSSSDKICCLCTEESKRSFKLFSIAGKGRNICKKIETVTGIAVLESDGSPVICQKCDRFVESVICFKKKCYENQLKLQRIFSVKRVISPPKVPDDDANKENIVEHKSRKQLAFGVNQDRILSELEINIQPKKTSTKFISIAQYNLNPLPAESICFKPSANVSVFSPTKDIFLTQPLTRYELEIMNRGVSTTIPSAIANNINKIESLNYALKIDITKKMDKSCKKLCKKENGTVLYNTDYDNMAEFNFTTVWNEILSNHPFFIDIMNAMAGQYYSFSETPDFLRIKYCFIYSILMSTRWHALTLIQRINTVLMINGGCSKKVSSF